MTNLTINVRFDEGLWSDAHETETETADMEIGESSEYESEDSEVDAEPKKGLKRRHDNDILEGQSTPVEEPDAIRHKHSGLPLTLARNLADTLDGNSWRFQEPEQQQRRRQS